MLHVNQSTKARVHVGQISSSLFDLQVITSNPLHQSDILRADKLLAKIIEEATNARDALHSLRVGQEAP